MWCILASPLLIGCDLTTISEASLNLLKNEELIALNQDPLGLQAYVVQHEGEGYVLVKDIEKRRGTVRAVALYNPSDTLCSFSVPMQLLELAGNVKLRDLVQRKNLKPLKDGVLEYTLNPRSVLILRAEGEQRIEPVRYEAEWAYLPCFNDLGKSPKTAAYTPIQGASGGMGISHIGGSMENHALWSVYSEKGGKYMMNIHYIGKPYSQLEINMNNDKTICFDQLETETGKHASLTCYINLQPGFNSLRMGSSYCWAPNIDCFTLLPVTDPKTAPDISTEKSKAVN